MGPFVSSNLGVTVVPIFQYTRLLSIAFRDPRELSSRADIASDLKKERGKKFPLSVIFKVNECGPVVNYFRDSPLAAANLPLGAAPNGIFGIFFRFRAQMIFNHQIG